MLVIIWRRFDNICGGQHPKVSIIFVFSKNWKELIIKWNEWEYVSTVFVSLNDQSNNI